MQSDDWYVINTEGHNDIIIKTNQNISQRKNFKTHNYL